MKKKIGIIIVCFASLPRTRKEHIKYITSSSGHRTHNLSRLQTHACTPAPLVLDWYAPHSQAKLKRNAFSFPFPEIPSNAAGANNYRQPLPPVITNLDRIVQTQMINYPNVPIYRFFYTLITYLLFNCILKHD